MNIKIAIIVIIAALGMALLTFYNYQPYLNGAQPAGECIDDSDCVPEQCCHPTTCTTADKAPNCKNVVCTLNCEPGTMDCGQGSCMCIEGSCKAVIENV